MKLIKSLSVLAVAVALTFGASSASAVSCCVKAKAGGKDCAHPCCVTARGEEKTCEKCQKTASCCDKAIAKKKDCAHPCCVEAAKEKKVCEKCNKKEEAKV
ncbi:MAG: hypothetical protein ACK4UN_00990 [Limisphaerales bacterium]